MKTALTKFKQYLETRHPGRSTAKHYMSDLAIFSTFVGEQPLQAIGVKNIDEFVQSQSEQGLKATTINRRLAAISSFFEYLISEEEDNSRQNPVFWKRHSVRQGQRLPRDVTDDTVERLFAAIDDSRDYAMFTLMIRAGLRVGEVATLQLENVQTAPDSSLTRLRVCGKGDKERIVWLTLESMARISQWLAVRPKSEHTSLFLNQHGRPLSVAGIQYRLKHYCKEAGLQLTCHQLRHTFARRLTEQGMPIESLAKLLGHKDLQTTQRYIDGADPGVRIEFLRAMSQSQPTISPEVEPVAAIFAAPRQPEGRPAPKELLETVKHLGIDLPVWLQHELHRHTLRRIPRWSAHRAKAQVNKHFGTLCRICRWLVVNRQWSQLDGLQRSDMAAFVDARCLDGLKPRSIGSELSVFRMFWRELLDRELVVNGGPLRVKAPAAGQHLPRYLKTAEFHCLEQIVQEQTASNTPADLFNRTWFYLLAHGGLRLSELLNLRLDDCDLAGKRLRIVSGKGKRDRVLPLTDYLISQIQAYLVVREPAPTDHLLVFDGVAVKPHLVPKRLQRWGKNANIVPLTPHRLRHTLATFLINQGMPVTSLQKFLGHREIRNTMIYAQVHNETVRNHFATAMAGIESISVSDWPAQLALTTNSFLDATSFDSP
jgi:site-specific recombinase XerD